MKNSKGLKLLPPPTKKTPPEARLPPAPRGLSREAKRWWKKYVSGWELDDSALLILESGLEAFDRMREAQLLLKKDGIVLEDRFKQKKPHPANVIERDSKQQLLRALKALNLDLEPIRDAVGRPPGR